MAFAAVFVKTDKKYGFDDENDTNSYYICGSCHNSFLNLYDLVLHESKKHFIEFSRVAPKLKSLIDEFIVPDTKPDLKIFKKEQSPEFFNNSFSYEALDESGMMDHSEETEIIRRLQESGQVSFSVKKAYKGVKRAVPVIKKETPTRDKVVMRKIIRKPRVPPKNRKVKDANSFRCSNCPETFEKYSLLREHEKIHKYICNFCGQSYTVKLNLKIHIFRVHKGIRTYCGECGIQTTDLEEHMKKHVDKQMYVCDICGKEVQGRQRINNHMNRSHKSRDARFFCQYCDQGFKYMADLNEHAIKHDPNKKDHKCLECGKAYKRRTELNRHLELHNGQKWKCEDCGREYAWKRGLWTHKTKGYCRGSVQ